MARIASRRRAAPPPARPAGSAPSVADQVDRRQALDAVKKNALGQRLSRGELAAIARQEKRLEADRLERAYASCAVKDVCAILGCQRVQLRRYVGYGLPANPDGTYNLAVAVPWLLEHERRRLEAEKEKGAPALEDQRRAQAQLFELRLAEKKGEVAPLAHFQDCVWRLFSGFSRTLEAWPRRAARSREEERHLAAEVRKLLAGFQAGVEAAAGARRKKQ